MRIQSLSVVVPTVRCVNNCPFCVSRMHDSPYVNQIEKNEKFYGLYRDDYLKRLSFARENGCNTVILTGNGEPLQNRQFLRHFADWNQQLGEKRFKWIDLQTTGVLVGEAMLRFLRNDVGVTTISVSVSDLFDNRNNAAIIGMPSRAVANLDYLCSEVKRYDFNLRISINMLYNIEKWSLKDVWLRLLNLGADQVTFRTLYAAEGTEQAAWIEEHGASAKYIANIVRYVQENGKPLERLPFGAVKYSVKGISTVVDDNCMHQREELSSDYRYLILQPNCKLYSRWDDPASLVF